MEWREEVGSILLNNQDVMSVPSNIQLGNKVIRKFQQQMLHFMVTRELDGLQKYLPELYKNVRGGFFCGPTGIGKTFVSIMLCAQNLFRSEHVQFVALSMQRKFLPINLIVCPLIINEHWKHEILSCWENASIFVYDKQQCVNVKTNEKTNLKNIPPNSFLLVSWDILKYEYNYSCYRSKHLDYECLDSYYFGRIIFDENQYCGGIASHKFQMCKKFCSIFKWIQTSTPAKAQKFQGDLKASMELLHLEPYTTRNLDSKTLSLFMWANTHEQIQDQLSIPPLQFKTIGIAFSDVERAYYDLSQSSITDKFHFCKMYEMNNTMLSMFVIEAKRFIVNQAQLKKIKEYYDLALYYKNQNCKKAIELCYCCLDISYEVDICGNIWKQLKVDIFSLLLYLGENVDKQYSNAVSQLPENKKIELDFVEFKKNQNMLETLFVRLSVQHQVNFVPFLVFLDKYVNLSKETDLDQLEQKKYPSSFVEKYNELFEELNTMHVLIDHNFQGTTVYELFLYIVGSYKLLFLEKIETLKLNDLKEYCLKVDCEKKRNLDEREFQLATYWKKKSPQRKWNKLELDPNLNSVNCYQLFNKNKQIYQSYSNCLFFLEILSKCWKLTKKNVSSFQTCPNFVNWNVDKMEPSDNNEWKKQVVEYEKMSHLLLQRCVLCDHVFDYDHIPVFFEHCQHNICQDCVTASDAKCGKMGCNCLINPVQRYYLDSQCDRCLSWTQFSSNQLCGYRLCENCYLNDYNTCLYCGVLSTRTICNIPVDLKVSEDLQVVVKHKCETRLRKKVNNVCAKGSKLEYISSFLDSLPKQSKVLVFDQNVAFLETLASYVHTAKKFVLKQNQSNTNENIKYLEEFKKCQHFAILFLSTVGTAGLNLIEANVVVLCSPIAELSVETQCIQRAHRFGQTQEVKVYQFFIENTVEHDQIRSDQLEVKYDNHHDEEKNFNEYLANDEQNVDIETSSNQLLMNDSKFSFLDLTTEDDEDNNKTKVKKEEDNHTEVFVMLKHLKMEEYFDSFEKAKYELLSDMTDITCDDLDYLGVHRGRRARLYSYLEQKNIKRQKA